MAEDPEELTDEDYIMVEYFYKEKDVESWVGWERAKPLLEKKHPELMHAFKQLEIAEKTLTVLIEAICR